MSKPLLQARRLLPAPKHRVRAQCLARSTTCLAQALPQTHTLSRQIRDLRTTKLPVPPQLPIRLQVESVTEYAGVGSAPSSEMFSTLYTGLTFCFLLQAGSASVNDVNNIVSDIANVSLNETKDDTSELPVSFLHLLQR